MCENFIHLNIVALPPRILCPPDFFEDCPPPDFVEKSGGGQISKNIDHMVTVTAKNLGFLRKIRGNWQNAPLKMEYSAAAPALKSIFAGAKQPILAHTSKKIRPKTPLKIEYSGAAPALKNISRRKTPLQIEYFGAASTLKNIWR